MKYYKLYKNGKREIKNLKYIYLKKNPKNYTSFHKENKIYTFLNFE